MIPKMAKNKVQFQEKFDPNVKTVIRNVPGIVQTKIDGKSFETYLEKIKSHWRFHCQISQSDAVYLKIAFL